MPIAFSPRQTITIVIERDEAKPEDQQIKWTCRPMTGAQTIEYEDLIEQATKATSLGESVKLLTQAILMTITAWNKVDAEGHAIAMDEKGLLSVFTPRDLFQVARQIPMAQFIGEGQVKN